MTRKHVKSISGEHPVSVKELLVNSSEGVRETDSFLLS